MKTLDDLTPEIEARIPLYKERVLKGLCNGTEYKTNKLSDTIKYVHKIYELSDNDKPLVILAKNPKEYKLLFTLLPYILSSKTLTLDSKLYDKLYDRLGDLLPETMESLNESMVSILNANNLDILTEKKDNSINDYDAIIKELSSSLNRSSWGWYCSIYSRIYLTWFKFIQDEFKIEHDKMEILDELYGLINKTFISRCYFTSKFVLVLKTPKTIEFNEDNVLHNVNGPSYNFDGDDNNFYHVNGREVPMKYITEDITKEMFLNETNEDLKACMITIIKERDGNEGLLKFLNAELIDEQKLAHYDGYDEIIKLYKTKESYNFLQDRYGNFNQKYCWTEITCPSTNSVYLIDNSADFTDALVALKFLRPSFVPEELSYVWENFAN